MPNQTSCTIIIFHYESLEFLKLCLSQIKKYQTEDIKLKIIVCDQSWSCKEEVDKLQDENVKVIHIDQYGSGYSIDYCIHNNLIDTEYICTLDCDAFPVSKKWLYVPISLIQKYNLVFVGNNTGIENNYKHLGNFFVNNQYFRVGKIDFYTLLSKKIGFIKGDYRSKVKIDYEIKLDKNSNNIDDSILANLHSDDNNLGDKISLSVNKIFGRTPSGMVYGMLIDDLVFHFTFSNNSQKDSLQLEIYGIEYLKLHKEISSGKANIDSILSGMKDHEKYNNRRLWSIKYRTWFYIHESSNLFKEIENLKKQ